MAKRQTKSKAEIEILRDKAKILYLESRGTLTITQIGKEINVSRQSVSKWKEIDAWDTDSAEVKREIDTKIKSSIVANLFDELAPEYKEVSNNVRLVNTSITNLMWKRNKEGVILRDESGQPMLNTNLEPKDLRHVSNILATNLKTMRLLTGQSTENINQNTAHSGKVDHNVTHQTKGVIDDCMDKMQSGEMSHADGQDALDNLAIAFQDFRAKVK